MQSVGGTGHMRRRQFSYRASFRHAFTSIVTVCRFNLLCNTGNPTNSVEDKESLDALYAM